MSSSRRSSWPLSRDERVSRVLRLQENELHHQEFSLVTANESPTRRKPTSSVVILLCGILVGTQVATVSTTFKRLNARHVEFVARHQEDLVQKTHEVDAGDTHQQDYVQDVHELDVVAGLEDFVQQAHETDLVARHQAALVHVHEVHVAGYQESHDVPVSARVREMADELNMTRATHRERIAALEKGSRDLQFQVGVLCFAVTMLVNAVILACCKRDRKADMEPPPTKVPSTVLKTTREDKQVVPTAPTPQAVLKPQPLVSPFAAVAAALLEDDRTFAAKRSAESGGELEFTPVRKRLRLCSCASCASEDLRPLRRRSSSLISSSGPWLVLQSSPPSKRRWSALTPSRLQRSTP